ncbi:endolytic transglycosylase MltG [Mycolicibacterium grossiae]|uniref:Endolytic murein transglycosylase n=1 Tax=Mycolicibacterium grossiae TaxID=1552759 RepID=A0A1E8Q353_9MYCO|nr:endolytic transglycosylase MltG [Mycolicibacterium grossiae]OFJ52846.1 aminodeoxychorismate lyase [Mycolicibacterium grossiae]QEM46412.1 aminodeoxychorismate lyase [Mycolicibacterium grossiae]
MSDGPEEQTEYWPRDRQQPTAVGRPRRTMSRTERARAARARRRRRTMTGVAIGALIVVVIGAVFLGSRLWHGLFGTGDDYAGGGVQDIVIQVRSGDSTTAIGQTLKDANVVATPKAFVSAATGNSAITSIQPGYYKVRTEIPAADAVTRLADPQNRVGRLVIPEGRQLDDTADVRTKAVTDGIFSLISKATCVDLDGTQRCVPAEQLKEAAGRSDPAALSIPAWAAQPVAALGDDHRRIEGLIAPGTWDVDPSAAPQDILARLIASSVAQYEAGGLLDAGAAGNLSPYEILTVASLVQKESLPADFAKVARVIYNRLNDPTHRRLEFDSTVNYALDRQEVATTDADRGRQTPWNTYAMEGLPATPICSPGQPALAAAERPEPGDWLFFVTIDKQGTTLFTRDYTQHLANIEVALRNGVLDSAR